MGRKAVGAISLVLMLIALMPLTAIRADTSISHPKLMVYGTVTKDVYIGRSIWEYEDDQGLSSTLPFTRQQDTNITISFGSIVFDSAFENKTIGKAEESADAGITVTRELLIENDVEYIYLKLVNSTALSASASYRASETLTVDKTVSNDYYILVIAKPAKNTDDIDKWKATVDFIFLDAGANERRLRVSLWGNTATPSIQVSYNSAQDVIFYEAWGVSQYRAVQFKLADVISKLDLSYSFVKLEKVTYQVVFATASSVSGGSHVVEGFFKAALVNPSRIYIDDGTADGLPINGTSGQFPYDAGETINIYGVSAQKIVDVAIPFEYEVPYEAQTDGKNLIIQYTWEYMHPESPETGDQLTFANTNMTLYGYKDGVYWDKLTFNLQDKLTAIANKKVDSTKGYWTYCLVNGLTEGSAYQLLARVEYTAEEFDALTEAPSFWSNPAAWIMDKLLALLQVVASFLGLGLAAKIKSSRRALRRVAALLIPLPMLTPLPVMMTKGVKLTAKGERVSKRTSSFAALMLIIALFLGVLALYGGIVELPTWLLVAPLVIGYLALLWDATH